MTKRYLLTLGLLVCWTLPTSAQFSRHGSTVAATIGQKSISFSVFRGKPIWNPEGYANEWHYAGELWTINEAGKNIFLRVRFGDKGPQPIEFSKQRMEATNWRLQLTDKVYKGVANKPGRAPPGWYLLYCTDRNDKKWYLAAGPKQKGDEDAVLAEPGEWYPATLTDDPKKAVQVEMHVSE